MHIFNKKKGQSIIEVLVAMTLITVVIGSTFGLITRTINLVMIAQSRTEAVELAQKGLSEAILYIQDGCIINPDTNLNRSVARLDRTVNGKQLSLRSERLINLAGITLPENANAYFARITATVNWNDRGATGQTISISQYVRVEPLP